MLDGSVAPNQTSTHGWKARAACWETRIHGSQSRTGQQKRILPECKARQPSAFSFRVSMAVTVESGLKVGALSFPDSPNSRHTPAGQIEQTTTLAARHRGQPAMPVVNQGYHGVDHLIPENIIQRSRQKLLSISIDTGSSIDRPRGPGNTTDGLASDRLTVSSKRASISE
jgi:hypothetical protein